MKNKNFLRKVHSSGSHGFTLVELLVVISVIAILTSLVSISLASAQKQARDTTRKSDLSQYRSSLEMFANKNNGLFPLYSTSSVASVSLCEALGSSGTCPEDPKYANDNTYLQYQYQSDGSGVSGAASATKYVLWSKLENVATTFWVVCSTGQSGKITSTTSISSGDCPAGLAP